MAETTTEASPGAPRELIVVIRPGVQLPETTGHSNSVPDSTPGASGVQEILISSGANIFPIFERSEQRIQAGVAPDLLPSDLADAGLDLTRFYRVSVEDAKADEVATKLAELEEVAAAYVKPAAEPPIFDKDLLPVAAEPPVVSPSFVARQGYLNASPEGVGARWAWNQPGGRGQGVRIIDIEGAWRFTHEDLVQHQGGVVGGFSSPDLNWRNHGTAVLGECSGDQNRFGIVGICDQAFVSGISFMRSGSARALWLATCRLRAGDIILIELHRPGPRHGFSSRVDGKGYIPIEWWEDDYAAILAATTKGIVVVAAAGNGYEDLDDDLYEIRPANFPTGWRNPFRRSNRDSGAILVGAGAPPPGTHGKDHGPDRSRLLFSNYGSSIDAQGWGREVTTCGFGDLQGGSDEDYWYTDRFSGTSSAAPIVVGAIGCLQGIARTGAARVVSPAEIRQRLRGTGATQTDGMASPSSQRIGNRPDIVALAMPEVELLTPDIEFGAIPIETTTVSATVFAITSLGGLITTLKVTELPSEPFGLRYTDTVEFDPAKEGSVRGKVRIWFDFNGKEVGREFESSATIVCRQTAQKWEIRITANTIENPTVATALVLDRSGSMGEDAGLGNQQKRIDVLRQAASVYVDLMDADDGVGVVSFSDDALVDLGITEVGDDPFGGGRVHAKAAIGSLTPNGMTSIGDGVERASEVLSEAAEYDRRALVVLTDGYENTPAFIADVGHRIQSRVFAIGVGTPDRLKPGALDALTSRTGGYLMMTGDQRVDVIRLSKYFVQVLSGVENSDIVVDPVGRLSESDGFSHRIPFQLTDSDLRAEAMLLLPRRDIVRFALETPRGQMIEPTSSFRTADFEHVICNSVTYWRIGPPAAVESTEAPGRPWHAVLRVDGGALDRMDLQYVPYLLVVKASSNLNMEAILSQASREPEAWISISVKLSESGSPLRSRVNVTAHIEMNDEVRLLPEFREVDGHHITEFQMSEVGSYPIRIRAEGLNARGQPFTREQLRTVSVWQGGDDNGPSGHTEIRPPESEARQR